MWPSRCHHVVFVVAATTTAACIRSGTPSLPAPVPEPIVSAGAAAKPGLAAAPVAAEDGALEHCSGLLAPGLKQSSAWMAQRAADTRARAGQAAHAIVVANDARATEIGLAMLRSGGSAADTFVATSLAETVLYPGVSSIAGFMHVLYYDAKTKTTTYVVGAHRAPRDAQGAYRGPSDPPGRAVAIPGAVFGFAELVQRFGRRPLAEATRGAAKLARDGFDVNEVYASIVSSRTDVLARTPYGRSTYLPGGRAVMVGDTLRLPAYAATLDHLAQDGASFFSRGGWAKEFVEHGERRGGCRIDGQSR